MFTCMVPAWGEAKGCIQLEVGQMTHTNPRSQLHVWDRKSFIGVLMEREEGLARSFCKVRGRCTSSLPSLYLCLPLRKSCFPEGFVWFYSQNKWNKIVPFCSTLIFVRNKGFSYFFESLNKVWCRSGVLPDLASLRQISSMEGEAIGQQAGGIAAISSVALPGSRR